MLTFLEVMLFIILFGLFLYFARRKVVTKIVLGTFFMIAIVLTFSISFRVEDSFRIRSFFSNVEYEIVEISEFENLNLCIYQSPNGYFEIDIYDKVIGITMYSVKQFDFDYFQSDLQDVLYVFTYPLNNEETILFVYLPSNQSVNQIYLDDHEINDYQNGYFLFTTSIPLSSTSVFKISDIEYRLP